MAFWDFRREEADNHNPLKQSIDLKLGGEYGFTVEFEGTNQANVTDVSYFNGGEKADSTFYHDYDASYDIYIGSQYSDRMVGDGWGNIFQGANGNDFLYGQGGEDILQGENGDDTIDGGADRDFISGGEGNDKLIGGAGNDEIDGGAGQDTVSGGDGNDLMVGGAGNDTMRGGFGADTLIGGAGHDELYAGASDGAVDTFKFGADAVGTWASADYIYEFDHGQDQVKIDLWGDGTGTSTTPTGVTTAFQQVGGNTHVFIKGDFDGVTSTIETVSMSFIGGTAEGVSISDFLFV